MKLTSPNLNYFIILGALSLYIGSLIRVTPSTSLVVWDHVCRVSGEENWLMHDARYWLVLKQWKNYKKKVQVVQDSECFENFLFKSCSLKSRCISRSQELLVIGIPNASHCLRVQFWALSSPLMPRTLWYAQTGYALYKWGSSKGMYNGEMYWNYRYINPFVDYITQTLHSTCDNLGRPMFKSTNRY